MGWVETEATDWLPETMMIEQGMRASTQFYSGDSEGIMIAYLVVPAVTLVGWGAFTAFCLHLMFHHL
jgi:hypothetical protein